MGSRRNCIAASFVAITAIACSSPSLSAGKTMADVMVDWPTMIGERLIIEKGYIILAQPDGAMLKSDAGRIFLSAPFKERDDMRYLLTYCTDVRPPKDKCSMRIEGTIAKSFGNEPDLKDVDLEPPK